MTDQPIQGIPLGIDISYYEGQWNADIALAHGVSFMSARACVGNNPDSDFLWDWASAKGKMIRNAYGLFDAGYAPNPQADLLCSIIESDIGEIPPTVDYEPNGALTDVQWQAQTYYGWKNLYNYIARIQSNLGIKKVTLYTNLRGLNTLPSAGTPQAQWFIDNCDLWITTQPYTPAPRTGFFPTWKWMQYSFNGDGKAFGTQTLGVDINTYNGTLAQMQAEFPLVGNAPVVTPVPITPPAQPPATDDPITSISITIQKIHASGKIDTIPSQVYP